MEKKYVIKHSALVEISNTIGLIKRKMFNVLLANAYSNLLEKDEFMIDVDYLLDILSIGRNNKEFLKDTLRDLVGTTVEFNLLGKSKEDWDSKEWRITSLLPEAGLIEDNKICVYKFSDTLKKRLYHPKMYAKISLVIQSRLESKHSLALYELCIDYFFEKKEYGQTPIIDLKTLRTLLGIKNKDTYRKFKYLNRDILKPSIKEINEKTKLSVEVEYIKKGRKVVGIKLHSKLKDADNPLLEDRLDNILDGEKTQYNRKLYKELIDYYTLTPEQTIDILEKYDETRIKDVLEYVREKIELGEVKNIPVYTMKAIKENWIKKKSKFIKDKEKQQKELERIKKERKKEIDKGKKIYNNLLEDEKQEIIKKIINNSSNENIKTKIKLFGFEKAPKSIRDIIFQGIYKQS